MAFLGIFLNSPLFRFVMDVAQIERQTGLERIADLDRYFEISSVKGDGGHADFLIREIRRKIIAHITSIVDILEHLLSPDSSFLQLHDAQAIEGRQGDALQIVKEFNILVKQHQLLEIASEHSREKLFCSEALACYEKNISLLQELISLVRDSYSAEIIAPEKIHYLG